ncbi:ABC transporter permease [Panacagrimonas sp.]|uniref:ABC transporter permease n=1 Tax=Panacagrimonas sp. TaxID=2480088 RepID=UPI003B52E3AE
MPPFRSLFRRALRSTEILILAAAVAIAVAASSAVGLFSDRVSRALEAQSGDAFGADAAVRSRDPLPEELAARIGQLELRSARLVQFPSVAFKGEVSSLASVKATDAAYPLRGKLRTTHEPFGDERTESNGPPSGEAWVDLRLWQDLQLSLGDQLELGRSRFRVTRIVTYEPDRGGGFSDLAPRMLVALEDLRGSGLIGPGSRVQYKLLLAGAPEQIEKLGELELPSGVRMETAQEGRREIGGALGRARQFLDIAVLSAMLLAGAAIAASAHQHGQRLRDEAAIYKVLGATSARIAQRSLLRLLALALGAGAIGMLVGWIAQGAVAQAAQGLTQTPLPPAQPVAALWSLGLALLLVFGFAAPAFLTARHTPPIRVFQRAAPAGGSRLAAICAALAAALLVGWHTGDAQLAVIVLAGALGAALVLGLLSWMLVRALAALRARGGTAVRFGLANIARRRWASVGQAVALGLALLALLLVGVVRSDLLSAWENRLPDDAPNQFLINIQPDQVAPLESFFDARGVGGARLWPMTRARLVALRGDPVSADSFDDPEARRWVNREFNISWTDRFGDDNRLLEGQWWPADTQGKAWLSVDDTAVERLDLKLGDTLSLQIADRTVDLSVYNIRKVSWDSFRPNFFLVVPPGVIDDNAAQWLTSFHLRPEQRPLLRELIREFPNITALDLDAAIAQVRSILERVVGAVEFLFLFTLAAGLTVLLAAIEGTRSERVRETALLRTLGASNRTIHLGLLAEYAALGLVAGLVAAAAAQVLGWSLADRVFELPYRFSFTLWAVGALGGATLVALMGWLSLQRTLRTPPRMVLAANA